MASAQDLKAEIESKKVLIALQNMLAKSTGRTADEILRSNRAHKQSSAVLRTIEKITNDTERVKNRIAKTVVTEQKRVEKAQRAVSEKIKEQRDLVIAQKAQLKVSIKDGNTEIKRSKNRDAIAKATKKIDKLEKASLQRNKDFKKYSKERTQLIKKEEASKRILGDIQKKYAGTDVYYIRNAEEYNEALEHRLKLQEEGVDALLKAKRITAAEAVARKKNLRGEENIAETREGLRDKAAGPESALEGYRQDIKERLPKYKLDSAGRPTIGGKQIDEKEAGRQRGEAAKFAKDKKQELGKEMSGNIKSLFSARGVGGKIAAARDMFDTSKKSKILADEMKAVGVNAKGAAGMFSMLGSAMGMLGKLGWVGLLLSAVQAIASAVNQSDKLIKGLNQSFMKMQGSTVGMKDVRKSMRTFTDSVFDMNRNLKYGINSEQIMGLFDAMSVGGMSLQGVGKRVGGGYNEVIKEAAELSLDLGVELSDMGGMIQSQMIDMKSTIGEASDSLQQMSYDASIAGIKSQKFYEAISSATDALSFYGNYLANTSTLLKTFSEAGALGFKDASKEVQELTGMFSGMDSTKRMGFIQVAGEEKVRALLKEKATQTAAEEDAAAEEIKKIDKDIDAAKKIGDGERVASLMQMRGAKEEERQTKKRQKLDMQAGAEGSVMAMQAALPYLAGSTMSLMQSELEKNKIDIFNPEDLLAATKTIQNFANVSEDTVRVYASTLRNTLDNAKEVNKAIGDGLSKASEGTKKGLKTIVDSYKADIVSGKVIDYDKMKSDLQGFKDAGFDFGMSIDEFMSQFEKNAYVVADAVDAAAGGAAATVDSLKVATKAFIANSPKIRGGKGEQEKVRAELVKNSMSFEKMVGIGKETLAYMAASKISEFTNSMINDAIIGTAESAKGILSFLRNPKTKTGEEREKDPIWKAAIQSQERLTLLQMKAAKAQDDYNWAIEHGTKKQIKAASDQADAVQADIVAAKGTLASYITKGAYGSSSDEIESRGKDAAKKEDDRRRLSVERIKELKSSAGYDKNSSAQKEVADLLSGLKGLIEDSYIGIASGKVSTGTSAPVDYLKEAPSEPAKPVKNSELANKGIEVAKLTETDKALPTVKDALVTQSGLMYGTKGDILANMTNGAKMVSAGMGQFANKLLPGSGAQAGTSVTLQLSIGNLNGVVNTESFLKEAGPALQQLVAREYNERQKRN
jgi:hypothetical protein